MEAHWRPFHQRRRPEPPGRRALPAPPTRRTADVRRPQARSWRGYERRALDRDFNSLPFSPAITLELNSPLPLPLASKLRRRFPFPLEDPLALDLSRRFPLEPLASKASPRLRRRTRSETGRWSQKLERRILQQITKQRRVGGHPVHRAPANARNRTHEPAHDLVPPNGENQTPALIRRIQDRRVAPDQPSQILAINAEFRGSLGDIAKMPAQRASRPLVGQMRQRYGPLRKRRHQRSIKFRQLRLRSGPWPLRSHEIRLIARIADIYGFTRRPPANDTKLRFAQRRLEPRTALHRAPQRRGLEPQWRLALQLRAKPRNATLSTLPAAHWTSFVQQPASAEAPRAQQLTVEQPQHPGPPATARANKITP
jgi:hypothetical protein